MKAPQCWEKQGQGFQNGQEYSLLQFAISSRGRTPNFFFIGTSVESHFLTEMRRNIKGSAPLKPQVSSTTSDIIITRIGPKSIY